MASEKIFPQGEQRTDNFTGEVYFNLLFNEDTPLNTPIANVTFKPGGRTKWHSHEIGQVLLVTHGEGWYQEEGKEPQTIKAGDVINIDKDVVHWHGAKKDSELVHLALTAGEVDWMEPVEGKDI